MKIRTQFTIIVALFGVILIVVAASLILTSRHVQRLQRKQSIAHELEVGARELSYLFNHYLLHGESQQRARWEAKFSSFSDFLSGLRLESLEQAILVNTIQANRERLKEIFTDVASTLENRPPASEGARIAMLRVSWSRMEVQNEGIAFDASRLHRMLEEEADRLRHRRVILLFILIGVFGVFLVINYGTVNRHLLHTLSKLQAGAKIIGSGDLDFTIKENRADEIGDLSRAFNQMNMNLKAVTASKADLEREISERRKAEQALRKSEQRWAVTLASIGDAVIATDTDGRVTFLNNVAEELTGWSIAKAIGKPVQGIFRIINEATRAAVEDPVSKVLQCGMTVGLANYSVLLRKDCSELPIDDSAAPIRDEEGQILGVVLIFRDISKRSQAENELRESERRYRSLFDNMSEGFALHEVITDDAGRPIDYRFLEVNPAFEHLTGLKRDDLLGRRVLEVLPATEPYWVERYGQVALAGEPARFEDYSGELEHWYEVFAFQPAARQFAVVFSDITERKQAEERERQDREQIMFANRLLRVFIEHEGDELFDRALAIVLAGMASKHGVFGYIAQPGHLICPSLSKMLDACELEGKCIHYPPEKWKGLWVRALTEKQSLYTNDASPVPPGHPLIHNNIATPILFQGDAIGLLNLANKEGGYTDADRDMLDRIAARIAPVLYAWIQRKLREDERLKSEEELRQLNETLEQQVAERTELAENRAKQLQALVLELAIAEQRERRRMAEILHDHLQQFLVAARMNFEVLSGYIGTDHKRDAENILNLINQSIQASRTLTAELSPPVLQQGSLSAALEWLAGWMRQNHGLMIELSLDPDMDPKQEDIIILLFQSIRELLFNVVKHAEVKSARVEMFRDLKNNLRIAIIDQGPGLHPDSIREKTQEGTGFGIFSIRERLKLLGGSLEIESAPGTGATFSLVVPLLR